MSGRLNVKKLAIVYSTGHRLILSWYKIISLSNLPLLQNSKMAAITKHSPALQAGTFVTYRFKELNAQEFYPYD